MARKLRHGSLICGLDERLFRSVEVVNDPYFQSYGIQTGVGEFCVTIGEVGTSNSGYQIDAARNHPVQLQSGIDVGVGFRAYDAVVPILKFIIGLPAE